MKTHTVKINCTNIDRVVDVPIGLTLSEVAEHLGVRTKYTIVGATVNNKHVGLTYRVFQPKRITFFDVTHAEGMRTYVRSLIMMLYVAMRQTFTDAELYVLRSVSKGLYCEIVRGESNKISPDEIEKIKVAMQRLQQQSLPIGRDEIETSEALKLIDATSGTAELLRQHGDIYTKVYSLGGHSLAFFGDLVHSTSVVDVFDLVPYFNGLLLQLPQPSDATKICPLTRQDKMFAVFTEFNKWQELMHIRHLSDLNQAIIDGRGAQVMQVAEALHEKKISEIADMIASRRNEVRNVLIAGPSSSGKTTFSKRLAVQLVVNAIRPVTLSIDNYFVNREDTPRDEDGEYDFEALEAIDIELFNQQLLALLKGEEIEIPKFDFTTGHRVYDGERLRLYPNDVLIIEGTHGLTPQLTHLVPAEAKFKIYISPLASINFDAQTRINTTDNRLIRRIVRDYKYRGYSAEDTIARWPSVRRGEDKYIYPNQEQADVMFNSALLYELAVLKAQAEPVLLEVARNSPQYSEARRLTKFLSYIKPLPAANIPPTSILREFLGGSSFSY